MLNYFFLHVRPHIHGFCVHTYNICMYFTQKNPITKALLSASLIHFQRMLTMNMRIICLLCTHPLRYPFKYLLGSYFFLLLPSSLILRGFESDPWIKILRVVLPVEYSEPDAVLCLFQRRRKVSIQRTAQVVAMLNSALMSETLWNLTRWETAWACLILVFRPFVRSWLNRHYGWGHWLGKRNFRPKPYSEMRSLERLTCSSEQQR